MKKKKLTSLDILDGKVGSDAALSRTEMKQIMGGSTNCIICPWGHFCGYDGNPPGPQCSYGDCGGYC